MIDYSDAKKKNWDHICGLTLCHNCRSFSGFIQDSTMVIKSNAPSGRWAIKYKADMNMCWEPVVHLLCLRDEKCQQSASNSNSSSSSWKRIPSWFVWSFRTKKRFVEESEDAEEPANAEICPGKEGIADVHEHDDRPVACSGRMSAFSYWVKKWVLPFNKAVAKMMKTYKTGEGEGTAKLALLQKEVRCCSYRDVHIMWGMLNDNQNCLVTRSVSVSESHLSFK